MNTQYSRHTYNAPYTPLSPGSGKIEHETSDVNITSITTVDENSIKELAKVRGPAFSKFLGRLLGKAVSDRQLVDVRRFLSA